MRSAVGPGISRNSFSTTSAESWPFVELIMRTTPSRPYADAPRCQNRAIIQFVLGGSRQSPRASVHYADRLDILPFSAYRGASTGGRRGRFMDESLMEGAGTWQRTRARAFHSVIFRSNTATCSRNWKP